MIEEKEKIKIENMIYEIRGCQVMLDSDLAKLYQCKNGTKTINQAVKRHINRFPERFMFQLNNYESKIIWSQVGTKDKILETRGGKYKNPYVFTEQGVAMLATILRTNVAETVSIQIMDAFVMMRKYISTNLLEQKYINNMVIKHEEKISLLQESFSKFEEKKKVNEIYFNGQIYDAYSKIIDIMKEANKELIIIDSYADKSVLNMISKVKIKVILITSIKTRLTELDIKKYQEQYNNLHLIYNNTFHDRYFIIDDKTIYHCGTSLNYAGSRTFSINILEDELVKDNLIQNIKQIIQEGK